MRAHVFIVTITYLPTAEQAIDFWNQYKTDIPQIKKELGINSFRISIAWDRVAKPLGIPIIITENGIATDDDTKRTRFFRRALYTIQKLITEGYPIIGYTPWASHNNYEWPNTEQREAFTSRRYGFFHVNFDKESPDYLKRTLKSGAEYYCDFLRSYFQPKSP